MKGIGISSNNECGKTFDEVCLNVKKAGIDNIMLAFKTGDMEKNIITAKKIGLNIPYVHLAIKKERSLWAKGENNKHTINDVVEQLKLCSKYGIPIAVLHPTSGDPAELTLPVSEIGLKSIKSILGAAEKYNVKIALENLDKPNYDHFTYIMDNISSPWLGLCYDAGHHHLYNPEEDILGKYGDRILAVHLHDNIMDWQYGFDYTRDLHMLPFDGKIDYEKVCEKLAKTPYDNVIMLELHKIACGEPRLYKDMPVDKYLALAKERALKIEQMIENYRNNENVK